MLPIADSITRIVLQCANSLGSIRFLQNQCVDMILRWQNSIILLSALNGMSESNANSNAWSVTLTGSSDAK